MQTIVKDRQNIMDVALKQTGSIEQAYTIALLNNVSLSEEMEAGTALLGASVTNPPVVNGFVNDPATRDGLPVIPGGIDYMQIQTDFKVS